jgi:hypothetical protein
MKHLRILPPYDKGVNRRRDHWATRENKGDSHHWLSWGTRWLNERINVARLSLPDSSMDGCKAREEGGFVEHVGGGD